MLHALTLIHDLNNLTFHLCDPKLGWENQDPAQSERWLPAGANMFKAVETELRALGVAFNLVRLVEVRRCGKSIDYRAVFVVTQQYANTLDFMIISNGSKWAGESPDPICDLFARLEQHPLRANFVTKGVKNDIEFVNPAALEDDKRRFEGQAVYLGNFENLSAVFHLFVMKGTDTERALDGLIKANIDTLCQHEKRA